MSEAGAVPVAGPACAPPPLPNQALDPERTLRWLQHLDIFADVPAEDLRLLLDGMRWIQMRTGDLLEELAGGTDGVHILRYGSLGPSLHDTQGGRVEMAPLGPGDIHGELSAIAGASRPTSLVALRHSSVLRVAPEAFRAFLARSHQGALQVVRHLARSLLQNLTPRHRDTRPGSIALVALAEGLDLHAIGAAIAEDTARQRLAVELLTPGSGIADAAELCAVELVNDLTIMVTSPERPDWTALCIANADRLLYVDASDRPPLPEPPLERILSPGRRAAIDIAILHPAGTVTPQLPARWRDRAGVQAHLHIRRGSDADLGFLGRFAGGRAVGLVLAGGGARGYAHLGVVRALREAGIPIDIAAGTSMGGIVAAGLAMGWDDAELLERTRQVFAVDSPVNDYTLPLLALTRGAKVTQRLRHHFGDRAIEEAWRPFFCVSTSLSACAPHLHRSGPFWRALRATSALPGILPPVIQDGEVLVDGAIMNNFPVDEMRALGRGPVIGVDLGAGGAFTSPQEDLELRSALGLLRERRNLPVNIVSIMTRTATTSSLRHTERCRGMADLLIDPPVEGVGLLDWRSLDAVVERARDATLRMIEERGVTYASLLAGAGAA